MPGRRWYALSQVELSQFQVSGLSNFQINLRSGYNGYGMTGAFNYGSLVGADKAVGGGFSERAFDNAVAESLRRLREHNEFARNSRGDERAVCGPLHLLDGVDGGQADDGRSVLASCTRTMSSGSAASADSAWATESWR